MALADGGAEGFAGDGREVGAGLVLVEAPLRRPAVGYGDVGDVVGVALARGERVEAEEAAREAGDGAAVGRGEAASVAAGLLHRLREFGVGDLRLLALEHEPRRLEVVVFVKDEVGLEVGGSGGNGDFESDALRGVAVLVEEFRPEFGADFLFGVGPALGVVGGDVAYALGAAFA